MAVSLSQHFDRATLERAEGYFRAGHVVSVAADQRGGVESEVRNARGEVYRQTIEIEAPSARHPKGRIHGLCTCPMQSNCKHVAAALFALASGEARTPAPAVPTLSGPVQSWLRRARTLRETSAPPDPLLEPRPDDYPAAIKDRLCYVLDTLQPGLRIDLYKGRVNAQGTGLTKAMRRHDLLYRLRSDGAGAGFLRPVDLDLVGQLARARLLTGQPTYGYDLPEALQSRTTAGAALMRALCATGRLFVEAQPEAVLVWAEAAFPTTLGWAVAPDGSQRLSFISPTGNTLEVTRFGAESLWVDRRTGQIGQFDTPVSDDILRLVRDCPALQPREAGMLETTLPRTLGPLALPAPTVPHEVRRVAQSRHARLTLSAAKAREGYWSRSRMVTLPTLTLHFVYDGHEVSAAEGAAPCFVEGTDLVTLERDQAWETRALMRLQQAGAIPVETLDQYLPSERMLDCDFTFAEGEINPLTLDSSRPEDALNFAFREVPRLRADGWEVVITPQWPFRLAEAKTQLVVETASRAGERFQGHGWFELGFQVEINGKRHDLAPLIAAFLAQMGDAFEASQPPELDALRAMLAARPVFLDLGKGGFVPLDLSPIAPALHLFLRHHAERDRLHPAEATLAAEAEAALAGSDVRFADHAGILPLARSLQALRQVTSFEQPRGLKADLRGYQALGAAWMGSLVGAGFGGVLADDMGLGKTLQVLTLLQARKEQGAATGPALLIVPTSLLHGWQDQASRFTPNLELLLLHGPQRRALQDQIASADLVVTTYPLLARDRAMLAELTWSLVIID